MSEMKLGSTYGMPEAGHIHVTLPSGERTHLTYTGITGNTLTGVRRARWARTHHLLWMIRHPSFAARRMTRRKG